MCTSLSSRRLAPVVALCLFALAVSGTTARAGDTPFYAEGKFQLVAAQGTHYSFAGGGHAKSFGSFDAAVQTQANNGNIDESGVMTLDFGKVGTLTISFQDQWVPDAAYPFGGYRTGPYVVTGGTGQFAGAGGYGTLIGVPNGDGTGKFSLDGTLSN